MGDLRDGDIIRLKGGGTVTVRQSKPDKVELGRGKQGAVYKVVDNNGNEYALKWYHRGFLRELEEIGQKQQDPRRKTSVAKFYDNLSCIANTTPPSQSFLWPKVVTEITADKVFGYVMDIIPSNYTSLTDILNRVTGTSFDVMCESCINLCDAFDVLHTRGYSYQDLNHGGVYVDKSSGEVLVCDCDNVAPDDTSITNIQGFPGFMAPEVVTEADFPSRVSDTYSLSVVLFYLTMLGHPLEGRNELNSPVFTPTTQRMLYGDMAMFIFDDSGSNPPNRAINALPEAFWPLYPEFVRDAFKQAFSQGALHGDSRGVLSKARLDESQWHRVFSKLRTQLCECPTCHSHTFADPSIQTVACLNSNCGARFDYPVSLKTSNGAPIPVMGGKTVYEADVDPYGEPNKAVLKFGTSPQAPGTIALINLGSSPWTLSTSNGESVIKQVGESQIITDGQNWLWGLTIRFGNTELTLS